MLIEKWVKAWEEFMATATSPDKKLCVALAGGSTPKRFYEALSQAASQKKNSWEFMHIFWGDERCVPPSDPDSNFLMAREALLDHVPIPESNIHRIQGENDPSEEALRYEQDIQDTVESTDAGPEFDWVLLGLGGDGHTASLFPGQEAVLQSKNECAVARHPESGQPRITITLPLLNRAKRVSFLVTGKEKAGRVAEVLQRPESRLTLPAAMVEGPQIEWWLDSDAASQLKLD